MAALYLNSYVPLVASKAGRIACDAYHLPPFIDGSIRREPDFEHEYPAITCLCRAGKFAPRLLVGDVVAYATRVGRYGDIAMRHQRLTAVLQVHLVFSSHLAGAKWYSDRGLPYPSDCMIRGNAPKPLDQSHRLFASSKCVGEGRTHRAWDAEYRGRAMKHRSFVVCKKLWSDLSYSAPHFTREDLLADFGYAPGTQNPGALDRNSFNRFMRRMRVTVPLFGP